MGRISAAIFIVALFVRLAPTGFYVTPDEPIWVLRSAQFRDALREGQWDAVPQTGHPGMTTMALGALGVAVMERLDPAEAEAHLAWIRKIAWLAPENGAAFTHLAYFLPAARVFIALTVSIGLVLFYLIGRERLGERSARLLALFLAIDPFFAGHGGLLHTDALQATFVGLSVLWMVPPLRGDGSDSGSGRRVPWVSWVSASLFLALAGLTKMLGLLAAPGLALAIMVWGEGPWWRRGLQVLAIAVMTVAFVLAGYLPFWGDPLGAVQSVLEAVTYHEGIGLRTVFFLGRMWTDPGPGFYPLVLLLRLTPPVLIGIALWLGASRAARGRLWRRAVWALAPALVYVLAISLATKKFDRYALTAVPLLTMMAALAWRHAARRWRYVLVATLLIPWAVVALVPLQYASPLLGGRWMAQHVIPLGWGEASGFAAGKLNQLLPAPSTATVMTQNVPGAASLFAGETWAWSEDRLRCSDALIGGTATVADGYVLVDEIRVGGRYQTGVYVSSRETPSTVRLLAPGSLPGVPPSSIPPLDIASELPAWLAEHYGDGGAFFWLRAPQCYPLTDAQLTTSLMAAQAAGHLTCEPAEPLLGFETERCRFLSRAVASPGFLARFAGVLELVEATWADEVRAQDPLTVHLRWRPQVALGELEAYVALLAEDDASRTVWAEGGRQLVSDLGWPAPDWTPGRVSDAKAYVPISLDLPPGTYELVLRLSGSEGWLGLSYPDGTFGGIELPLGAVEVVPPPYPASQLDLARASDVAWPGVRVIGYDPPPDEILAGQRLRFSLGLERTTGTPSDGVSWELVCDGEPRAGGELPWTPSDPVTWPGAHRYVQSYAPQLPPALPEGTCQVQVWPTSHERAMGDAVAAAPVILGQISVRQRARTFSLSSPPQLPLDATVGDLAALVGADLSTAELVSDEPMTVTLYWRALNNAPQDWRVFVHLVGPDGEIWAQSDAEPDQSRAPTTTWVEGEIITDAHSLRLDPEAPSGRYAVYAGVYDARRGVRKAVYQDGHRVPGDRVEVAVLNVMP
ncbi:MAG: glycosyltransferase family 39 protein [Anaerolineae bacterium]